MAFGITTRPVAAGGRTGVAFVLENTAGTARAEVWPTHGFNCLRWQARPAGGEWADLLFVAPDWETNPVPTRSGHPILFPFPNRLRHGRFAFNGETVQLPLTESTGTHAIHGFTPRNPWAVAGASAAAESASVTGVFERESHPWPADFRLAVTYRLYADRLRVEAVVTNTDARPLPWGLGYHGYFRLPGVETADEVTVRAAGHRLWEAVAGMPTGNRPPVVGDTDFRTGRPLGPLQLDHLFGSVGALRGEPNGLAEVAALSAPGAAGRLSVWASAAFRELLLFTPPHRRAVAVEPYTCATDAANLAAAGTDAGWLVLPPGAETSTAVEYRWEPNLPNPAGNG